MVKPAGSLGRNGLQDWLIQRVSAVILAIYTAFLIIYFVMHPALTYEEWHRLFTFKAMQYASLLVLFSLMSHAWIGVWTIITDYVKPLPFRLFLQIFFMMALLICVVWGIRIIWSI